MKSLLIVAALLLLSCEGAPTASGPLTSPEVKAVPASMPGAALVVPSFHKKKTLLFDPREPLPTAEKISEVKREALLSELFPKRLKTRAECAGSGGDEESDIKSGQIAPAVLASASGAITRPGKEQVVFLVDVNECSASEDRIGVSESTLWWVVTEDGKIQSKNKLKGPARPTILTLLDIDQNGTPELLGIKEEQSMTAQYISVSLFTAEAGAMKSVEGMDYRSVSYSTCKAEVKLEDPYHSISVLYYEPTEPGKLPTFISEDLERDCNPGSTFKERDETKPAERRVLIDPREPSPKNRKLSANEQEELLAQLFTKRLKKLSQCKTRRTGAESEEDIKSGQIAPFIVASAEGSVTLPGKAQIVYLVDINECNAYVDRVGTGTSLLWVVTEASKVVAKYPIDTDDRPDILWLRDLNRDGLQEIVAIDEPWEDDVARYLRLFMMGNPAISSVDLSPKLDPMIELNTCKEKDLKPSERSHQISVIYFEPVDENELPIFIEEKFVKSCEKGAVFKSVE